MTLKSFFEKFEQFADVPNAVAKMRELVLELAVSGVLSERFTSDQDDDAWRGFISEFDQRVYSYNPETLPPFEIPAAWRWVCLNDLGKTKVRNDTMDRTRVSFIPMALISAGYGQAAQSEEKTWSEVKKAFTHFADGDVVMAKITPCFENAKSAVMRNLVNGFGAGTTELHVFRRSTNVILPEFVLIYLKTQGFITRGKPRMTGSAGQKRVPHDYFSGSPFPLPPLAEQKRIVARVDELMALCDRLEAQQQERETRHAALARASLARFADAPTPANLNFLFHQSYTIAPADLRKSILNLAVRGHLTDGAKAGEWPTVTMENVSLQITDGEHATPQRISSGVPLATAKNVRDGFLDLTHTDYVAQSTAEKCWRRCKPHDQDILMVCVGATTGRVCLAQNPPDIVLVRSVALIRPNTERIAPTFLNLFLRSPAGQTQIWENVKQSAQPCLYLGKMAKFKISLPPLAEQHRIVAKVDQLMVLVDQLEMQLAASNASAEKLMEALVAELTVCT